MIIFFFNLFLHWLRLSIFLLYNFVKFVWILFLKLLCHHSFLRVIFWGGFRLCLLFLTRIFPIRLRVLFLTTTRRFIFFILFWFLWLFLHFISDCLILIFFLCVIFLIAHLLIFIWLYLHLYSIQLLI